MRMRAVVGAAMVAGAPQGLVKFQRQGSRLLASGAGTVTVRAPGGGTLTAKLPFNRDIPKRKKP